MREIVVDASAIIDSADMAHPASAEAFEELAGAFDIVAPSLILWEVANVVYVKAKLGDAAHERAEVVDAMLSVVRIAPVTHRDASAAGELAEREGISAYDAAYLSLACDDPERMLVTHDKRLLSAARRVLGPGRAFEVIEAQRVLVPKESDY